MTGSSALKLKPPPPMPSTSSRAPRSQIALDCIADVRGSHARTCRRYEVQAARLRGATDGARHDPTPVEIASPVDVAAAGDRHRQAVRVVIAPARSCPRQPSRHRMDADAASGLSSVYGSRSASPYALSLEATTIRSMQIGVTPADLQHVVRAPHVGLQRRQRCAPSDTDDRLRAEVEDRIDLVQGCGSLDAIEMSSSAPVTTAHFCRSPLRTSSDWGSASRTSATT